MHGFDPGPANNKLLAALSYEDFELLRPQLTTVCIDQGTVLCEVGQEVDHVHFPLSGVISIAVVMRNGKLVETATVGREGMFGAMSGLRPHISLVRAIAPLPMFASRTTSARLRNAASNSKPIFDLCLRYNEVLLAQAQINAACNGLHRIEARFCRWLLQTRDRVQSDTVLVTQEFLSEMLGVRRTSVTEMANKIQAAGAISCSRGVIKIVDLEAVKAVACECYETFREQTSLVGEPAAQLRAGR
jgi:CRP-like cAMP-binding protein